MRYQHQTQEHSGTSASMSVNAICSNANFRQIEWELETLSLNLLHAHPDPLPKLRIPWSPGPKNKCNALGKQ